MKSFALRSWPLALVLSLAACQTLPEQSAQQRFANSLASGQLEQAHAAYTRLQQTTPAADALAGYRQQLVDAYLLRSNQALQRGDLDLAAQALGQARSLLPQAPALSHDLRQALDDARELSEADGATVDR